MKTRKSNARRILNGPQIFVSETYQRTQWMGLIKTLNTSATMREDARSARHPIDASYETIYMRLYSCNWALPLSGGTVRRQWIRQPMFGAASGALFSLQVVNTERKTRSPFALRRLNLDRIPTTKSEGVSWTRKSFKLVHIRYFTGSVPGQGECNHWTVTKKGWRSKRLGNIKRDAENKE